MKGIEQPRLIDLISRTICNKEFSFLQFFIFLDNYTSGTKKEMMLQDVKLLITFCVILYSEAISISQLIFDWKEKCKRIKIIGGQINHM